MSCACKDSSSTFVLLTSTSESRPRPRFIGAVIAVVEAFQEALAMRRVAQRIYFLGDE
jgi:hypothetical protein